MTVPGLRAAEELEPKYRDCSEKAYTYTAKPTYWGLSNKYMNCKLK